MPSELRLLFRCCVTWCVRVQAICVDVLRDVTVLNSLLTYSVRTILSQRLTRQAELEPQYICMSKSWFCWLPKPRQAVLRTDCGPESSVSVALDRQVAVKVLTAELSEDRERFLREQRAMGRVTGHPNTVGVLKGRRDRKRLSVSGDAVPPAGIA